MKELIKNKLKEADLNRVLDFVSQQLSSSVAQKVTKDTVTSALAGMHKAEELLKSSLLKMGFVSSNEHQELIDRFEKTTADLQSQIHELKSKIDKKEKPAKSQEK